MRTLLLALALLIAVPAAAQDRVDPDMLSGTWKLEIDIDPSEGESALARIAIKLATGLMDEIEIRFGFMDDHRLRVMVNAFGNKDEDWSRWEITEDGYLALGNSDHFDVEDTVWYADGDRLVAFDNRENPDNDGVKGLALVRILE